MMLLQMFTLVADVVGVLNTIPLLHPVGGERERGRERRRERERYGELLAYIDIPVGRVGNL